jgi:hypothetical protein
MPWRLTRVAVFVLAIVALIGTTGGARVGETAAPAGHDARDDSSPWGVASGAEWFSAFPTFNPILVGGGIRWLRGFYEWQDIQPKQGYWNWALPDRLVRNAQANGIHLVYTLAYFAGWASADGGTRKFPIKNMQYWRDYVGGMVERYRGDIKYWEVWNEFNGSFAVDGSPALYADLVQEAFVAAKKADPTAKIGMSVANFDVGFLEKAIKAGAANHFDYICVHPYEKMQALSENGELEFLTMTTTLRQMLAANGQSPDIPLWITEIGERAPVRPDQHADRHQAVVLAKAYILSIAAGFQRTFWFEARGPAYGNESDFGLIRSDFTPRPSYQALKIMTGVLGSQPTFVGWLDLGDGGYGFVFDGAAGAVMAAWSPPKRDIKVSFAGDVDVSDLEGRRTPLGAGRELALTEAPVLVTGLPAALVQKAQSNRSSPYPWGGRYAHAQIVTARLQTVNREDGVKQINSTTTTPVAVGDSSWRRTDFSGSGSEGHYVYFAVDSQFVPFGTRNLEITAVVRRIAPDRMAGMSLNYESQNGYIDRDYMTIPTGDQWQELTWKVSDANFVGQWGWNFRLNAISSPNEFLIREVRVKRPLSP